MINNTELTDLQMDAIQSLTEVCSVSHPMHVSDGAGGYTDGPPVLYGPYQCRVEQSNRNADNLPVVADGSSPRRYVYIVMAPDAIIYPKDTLIVGTRRYPVLSVPKRTLNVLLRVQCWEAAIS